MDTTTLVDNKIEEGKTLLNDLEKEKVKLDDAMWGYDEDEHLWKLILTSPIVKEKGSLFLYNKINELLSERKYRGIKLENVKVLDTNDLFMQIFRPAFEKRQEVFKDVSLKDGYIYFLHSSIR